jgi:translation initiation factor 3 subunit F
MSNFNVCYGTSMNVCRYSTGLGVTGGSALIHDFYAREVSNPIHLTVDTGFRNGEGTIKAYVSANLSLGDRPLAAQFQEIPLDLRMVEAERVGCKIHFEVLHTCKITPPPPPLFFSPQSPYTHRLNTCTCAVKSS